MNEQRLSAPNRILVIKLADLGDVLTATPALRALRQTFPRARIEALITHHTARALRHSTLVDGLICSDNFRFLSPGELRRAPGLMGEAWRVLRRVRAGRFEAVLVLHHLTTRAGAWKYAALARASGARIVAGLDNGRGRFLTHRAVDRGFGYKHEVEYWLDVAALLGARTDDTSLDFPTTPAEDAWADEQTRNLRQLPSRAGGSKRQPPLVVIHPGSGGYSRARRWAPENFARVADGLVEALQAQIVLVGTPGDGTEAVRAAMQAEPQDLTGRTGLGQLVALLRRADLFIGGDSGVGHLAAAARAPGVVIFGPSNERAWRPWGDQVAVLHAPLPCAPCIYPDHTAGLRDGCQARTCLKTVAPVQVLAAAAAFLNGTPASGPPARPAAGPRAPATANILDVPVAAVTRRETLAFIEALIGSGAPHQVATVNPEFVIEAQHDAVFKRILQRAALAFPDGVGLLWAARILNEPRLPERVPGVEMVERLAELSHRRGYPLYFLGAAPGVAERAIANLRSRYPRMVVAGAYAGSHQPGEEDAIVERVRAARPAILFVAYGHPDQDKWIARNLLRLNVPVSLGVGGAFDFISGKTKRAPAWVRRLNLEWLYRFWRQPWRWRRIWNAVPRFAWAVLRRKLSMAIRRGG